MSLPRPTIRIPEFPDVQWINSAYPVDRSAVRGKIVLVSFWDFTCINCLRTLPYLRAWHQRYSSSELVMIGVHTPEFSFASDPQQVRSAAMRLGVSWPVALDNEQVIWKSYANRYWPTVYLIDAKGYVRYQYAGEGNYATIERTIQTLIKTLDPGVDLPDLMAPLRAEDTPGAVCYPTTPELHMSAIGNREHILSTPSICEIPGEREDGRFYLGGLWQVDKDGFAMASTEGSIVLPYHAAAVNGVFAPSSDPADLAMGFPEFRIVEIRQDDSVLPPSHSTPDLYFSESHAYLRVEEARSYALVKNPDVRPRELQLQIKGAGFSLYAFSFGSCTIPDHDLAEQGNR